MSIASTGQSGELDRMHLVPDLGKHGHESIAETLFPFSIGEGFVLAFDVLWVGGIIDNVAPDTICEFCDPPFDKAVDVE